MTLGEGLAEGGEDAIDLHYRMDLEQTAKDYHVESLDEVHLSGCVHGIYPVDVDVLPSRRLADSVPVVDDGSSRLYLRLELLQRGLVENDGGIVAGKDR